MSHSESPSKSPIYIIIGGPRSGTSALSSVLMEQGINMVVGSDSPDLDSPSGNREDALARLVHNQLMGRNGLDHICDWDNPSYVEGGNAKVEKTIGAYINFRQRNHISAWGLKDPRLSFLIEPWHRVTESMPVHWIHIHRENKDAMIRSLIAMLSAKLRHNGDDEGLYRLASNWAESYKLAIELGLSRTGIQPYKISYEELLTVEGQSSLIAHFNFQLPIQCIRTDLNRKGKVLMQTSLCSNCKQ